MDSAACYVRSSKDRHDVSLDAQRRELMALAKSRGLTIIETFQDAVESGKDDQRPGFQALLRKLKDPSRQWNYLLALDTSRIARNQYLAHAFHYECEKREIKVLYAKVPETNTVMDVVIRAVMQSFDELHSLMSKEKGLGGMAENVRQGWRAGGRAPTGYQLEHVATGAIRDGVPVTKSRLVPSLDASRVKVYMQARASGVRRGKAAGDAGLANTLDTTLIGMEWNALTYAGHTVWNVHAERLAEGGYKGGTKRRPRSEWVIQYDTHEQLISTDEAESILAKLEKGRPKRYQTRAVYLLSGLLVTPDEKAWHGDGDGCYRIGKGKRIGQEAIESAVVEKIKNDLVSDVFVRELVAEAQQMSAPLPDERLKPLRDQAASLAAKISKIADIVTQSEKPRVFLEKIAALEHQRDVLIAELTDLEEQQKSAEVLRTIGEKDVRTLLGSLANHLQEVDRESLKVLTAGLLEKVELCPTTLTCRLHYKIATGDLMASPRGFEPRLPP
jgi:site-specific DNA recombinase